MDVDQKLDKILNDVGEIKVVQAAQHVTLQEHIRRTELLEEDIKPIKKHVNMVEGALKFIGLMGILAGIYEAITWMRH
jgi:archaellum component FlaC